MLLELAFILAGIACLAGGGEALIRGATAVAARAGVSPLLTGLVIVGFGTSMPELVVSVGAALSGSPDIAIGNVIGSNIGNILLILGLCAVISPLHVAPSALRRDGVIVVAATVLFVVLAWGGVLHRWMGLVLLLSLLAYVAWTYQSDRTKQDAVATMHAHEAEAVPPVSGSAWVMAAAVIAGLGLLVAGAQLMVRGASDLAQELGASEATIGLTVVALGTSFPELTVSALAAVRRQGDVAIGNVLGSNIFNLLGILGVSALVSPLAVQGRAAAFDQWVMLGTAVLLFVFLATQRRVTRLEGGVLVGGYVIYIAASVAIG